MAEVRLNPFAGAEAICAPFVVLRSAGLPIATVRRYFDNRLADPVRRAGSADAEMAHLTPVIEAGLHAAVKSLDDDRSRHQAIELRRAIHNGRPITADKWAGVLSTIAVLDATLAERLRQWSAAHAGMHAAFADIDAADAWLDSEAFACSLLTLFDDDSFAFGISHSSPGLFMMRDKLATGRIKAGRRSRFVGTILSYLVRAGTKTSPITTFMQCTLLPIEPAQATSAISFAPAHLTLTSSLNRGIYAALLDRAAATAAPDGSPLALNPTFRIEEGQASVWKATYEGRDGRIWRSERLQRLRLGPTLSGALDDGLPAATQAEWARKLVDGGMDGRRATDSVRRLIDMGVLVRPEYDNPIAPTLARETADLLARSAVDPAIGETLCEIERDAIGFATMPTTDRIAVAQSIDDRSARLMAAVAAEERPADLTGLVIENSWWHGAQGHLGRDFDGVLRRALRTVANKLCVSPDYLWLRDQFITRFGVGGRCPDTLAFLTQAAAALPAEGAPRRPAFAPPDDLDLSGFVTPISFHLQIAGDGLKTMASADPTIVVNAVYPRGIWQLSRYTVLDDTDALVVQSARWLRDCAGDEEPVATLFGAAGVTLQNHGRLTRRMIDLTRVTPGEDWLRAADIVLRHDRATGRLLCEDRDGNRLRPFYLGGALPARHFGPTYLLNIVGEPVGLRPPPARMVLSEGRQVEMLRHQPRVTEGGCILLRATWWIKSRHLSAALGEGSFGMKAYRLLSYFEREGIPLENFMFGQSPDPWRARNEAAERFRKPMWCDLRNAWSVRRLLRIVEDMDYVVVREALPGLDQAILQVNGHAHISEFHVECAFRLPRSASRRAPTGHDDD